MFLQRSNVLRLSLNSYFKIIRISSNPPGSFVLRQDNPNHFKNETLWRTKKTKLQTCQFLCFCVSLSAFWVNFQKYLMAFNCLEFWLCNLSEVWEVRKKHEKKEFKIKKPVQVKLHHQDCRHHHRHHRHHQHHAICKNNLWFLINRIITHAIQESRREWL